MDKDRAVRQLKRLEKLGGEMRLAAEGWNSEWKILVTTIMSAQTKDETTIPVAQGLFKRYGSVRKLARGKVSDVEKLIRGVNYYKTKARNVVSCCKVLVDRYNGKVPSDLDLLVKLPGVGRKTGNVFLSSLGKDAIGVDTHVHYCSNYLGWVKSKYPEKSEVQLMDLFPKRYWSRINDALVRFGKNYTSKKEKNRILDEVRAIR